MFRLLFEKTDDAVYLSHLDLMRIFQRAFRRADILIWHSHGFSPRAYVSIALPLSVGVSSRCEILDFEIEDGSADLQALPERLNRTLPKGVRVLHAYESAVKVKHLAYLKASVTLEYDAGIPSGAVAAITSLFAGESVRIVKHGKKGEQEVDLRPLIRELTLCPVSEQELCITAIVSAQNPGLNPQLLVQAIEAYLPSFRADFARIERLEIFDEAMEVFR